MKGICFVQDQYVKRWLVLARCKDGKWERIANKIPYEIDDIRFRRALKYLSLGFAFFPENKPIGSTNSIAVPDTLIEEVEQELELLQSENRSIFSDSDRVSLRAFFSREGIIPQKVSLEASIKPVKCRKESKQKKVARILSEVTASSKFGIKNEKH